MVNELDGTVKVQAAGAPNTGVNTWTADVKPKPHEKYLPVPASCTDIATVDTPLA